MGGSRTSTFIAVYRGRTASDARLVALSADVAVVAYVVGHILADQSDQASDDPVICAIDRARRSGLHVVQRELQPAIRQRSDREPRP